MIMTLATILAALAFTANTDTTIAVRPGTRLEVQNFGGAIEVRVWSRNAVRVEAEHGSRARVIVDAAGKTVEVRSESRHGPPVPVDYRITTPVWMPLELGGVYTDVNVDGSKADVSAETVQGNVFVKGGDGFVKVSSIQGAVDVGGTRGRVEASSVNSGVVVRNVDGEVSVDAVNGDVILEGITGRLVEAETVNGDVTYLGSLLDGGRYRLASHQGDLVFGVPDKANAKVSIVTFRGDFQSDFPLSIERSHRGGGKFAFVLGSGGAVVDLESFAGTIRLERELKRLKERLDAERARLEAERDQMREERRAVRHLRDRDSGGDKDKEEDER